MPSSRVPLLFGTATFGAPGSTNGIRTTDPKEAQAILDTFFDHGYAALDTARRYGAGTTEGFLAQLDLKNKAIVDTKVSGKPADLRKSLQDSLNSLNSGPVKIKVRVLYKHFPDRSSSTEEFVQEIDKMHKEGLFEQFGLSNFMAWEVAEIYTLCKERGYVLPTYYQGVYNMLTRSMEPELLPCLQKFKIRFVAWGPLAGGFLTGKFLSNEDLAGAEKGSRYDKDTLGGKIYHNKFVSDDSLKAIQLIHEAASKEGLTVSEVALRWLQHHSALTPEDGVIIGASSQSQLENNITESEKGPLPETIVAAAEEAWKIASGSSGRYYF